MYASVEGKKFRTLKKFQRDEDGSLVMFSLFIFLAMLMFGGIAVDLMLYENRRTHIQNSTDRAVLAAANLNQTVDPTEVVQDYLAKVGVQVSEDDVTVVEIGEAPVITGRQVSVSVNSNGDTILMNLVGVDTLPYGATSEAEEGVNDVEVSLVLDISGSMSGTKLTQMQNAAKEFVDGILEGASDNRVSVSLIPYAAQVSAGPDLLSRINTTHDHSLSHCVNFIDEDFDTTAMHRTESVEVAGGGGVLPNDIALSQTAAFDPWRSYRQHYSLRYPVCRDDNVDIVPWSNDAGELKDRIDLLTANGNTSIDVAVKWGAALLDPSMNTVLNDMIADEDYDMNPEFTFRPRSFTYPDVIKVIVVMTDGVNTTQYALNDDVKEGYSNIYYDELPLDPSNPPDFILRVDDDTWWNMNEREYVNAPALTEAELATLRLSNLEMWSKMSMRWRAYNGWYRRTWNANDYYDQIDDNRVGIHQSAKNDRLDDICDAAKDNNVVIFSIGFEVTDFGASVMENCASTASHFYRVEGLDIDYAFASIKNQINKLKLTQ